MEGRNARAEIEVPDFPHFEVLSGNAVYSDHHFRKKPRVSLRNSALKAIAKEWKVLKDSLPDTIFLRAYEERMDILRAVIIGARGTPYHDGLFFFDISFPWDYPKNPPKMHYHSHGMRLNPNLYAGGYVCLSLINTWTGEGVEVWQPGKSTMLQLLVSIQGLVLNDKPYFNEPGAGLGFEPGTSPELERVAMRYNEDVFIYSCKTMLCKILHPPRGFEGFVRQHFQARVDSFLSAIRAYVGGESAVGSYGVLGSGSDSGASQAEVLDEIVTGSYGEQGSVSGSGGSQAEVKASGECLTGPGSGSGLEGIQADGSDELMASSEIVTGSYGVQGSCSGSEGSQADVSDELMASDECVMGSYDGPGSGSGSGSVEARIQVSDELKANLLKLHDNFQAAVLGVLQMPALEIKTNSFGTLPPLMEYVPDGEVPALGSVVEAETPEPPPETRDAPPMAKRKAKGLSGTIVKLMKCAFW